MYMAQPIDKKNADFLVNEFRVGGLKRQLSNLAGIAIPKERTVFQKSTYSSFDELKSLVETFVVVNDAPSRRVECQCRRQRWRWACKKESQA